MNADLHVGFEVNRNPIGVYLLGPEGPTLCCVFKIVSDDVGLLEEQAHRVGQLSVLPHFWILQLGGGEEPRQTDADETGDVVAVLQKMAITDLSLS